MTDDAENTRQSIKLPAVLSRTSIYTSLKSYDQATTSSTSQQQSSNSVQDAQLYSFYSCISENFHRRKVGLDCKNTSGRPHSAADMNQRIQQRALTLTSSSFHKRIGHSSGTGLILSSSSTGTISSRSKRKQKNHEILQRIYNNSSSVPQKHHEDFLQKLHQQWNTYMTNIVLKISNKKDQDSQIDLDDILAKLSIVSDNSIEWVGAKVRVDQCKAMQSKQGLVGILVSQTSRTWRIVPRSRVTADTAAVVAAEHKSNKRKKTDFSSQKKNTSNFSATTVPKQGTSLTALVQLPETIPLPNSSKNILCITLGWNPPGTIMGL